MYYCGRKWKSGKEFPLHSDEEIDQMFKQWKRFPISIFLPSRNYYIDIICRTKSCFSWNENIRFIRILHRRLYESFASKSLFFSEGNAWMKFLLSFQFLPKRLCLLLKTKSLSKDKKNNRKWNDFACRNWSLDAVACVVWNKKISLIFGAQADVAVAMPPTRFQFPSIPLEGAYKWFLSFNSWHALAKERTFKQHTQNRYRWPFSKTLFFPLLSCFCLDINFWRRSSGKEKVELPFIEYII